MPAEPMTVDDVWDSVLGLLHLRFNRAKGDALFHFETMQFEAARSDRIRQSVLSDLIDEITRRRGEGEK